MTEETKDLTSDLQFLAGLTLDTVSFVTDYVELHFRDSYLRCLQDPVIMIDQVALPFPLPGSRDALCSLIGDTVKSIKGQNGGELRVEFARGAVLTVSLAHEGRVGPEALHFRNEKTKETQYW